MARTHAVIDTPVDPLTAVRDDGVLVALHFSLAGHEPDPARLGRRDDAGFADVAAQLDEYFAGRRTRLRPAGARGRATTLQLAVWSEMRLDPIRGDRSYGEFARALGDRRGAGGRSACGRNPLAIVVPCHRVMGADGGLIGFGGGLQRKRFLLDLEQRGDPLSEQTDQLPSRGPARTWESSRMWASAWQSHGGAAWTTTVRPRTSARR